MKEEIKIWTKGLVLIDIPFEFRHPTFVSGKNDSERIEISYFRNSNSHIVSKVKFGKYAAGPPGIVHGGAITSVLDETMGIECYNNGYLALTKELSIIFLKPVPIGAQLFTIGFVEDFDAELLNSSSVLFDNNNRIYSTSKGVFKIVKKI